MRRQVQIIRYHAPFAYVHPISARARACCDDACPVTVFSHWGQCPPYPVLSDECFVAGDKAHCSIDDRILLFAAVRYYGLPVLVLILSATLASWYGLGDLACAGIGFSVCAFCQWLLLRRSRDIDTSAWRLMRIREQD